MSEIKHDDMVSFVTEKVNLPPDMVKKHRKQVNALRERLEAKIDEDPAFDLIKMLHAGSVAKGTALRTVNDLDVAVYVKTGNAPKADSQLIPWLADRLAEANPNMKPHHFSPQPPFVSANFLPTSLHHLLFP